MEQRVRRKCMMNRVDLVQFSGHATNPEDPCTVVRDRECMAGHVRQNRRLRRNKVASKIGRILETHHSGVGWSCPAKKTRSLLAYVADLAREQAPCRGGRVVFTYPWNWNVLTTCPILSVLN